MANIKMKECRQCRTQIDNRASNCPACRSKQPDPTKGIVLLILCGIGVVYMMIGGVSNSTSSAPPTPKPIPAKPTAGQEVSEEYVNYVIREREGGWNCKQAVEKSAKYDIKWKSWGYGFDYWNKYARNDGYLRISGDDAEAQNGFGNWVRANYSCTYDPENKTVINVTLDAGKKN